MTFSVSITGGPELQRALQDLGPVPARKLGIASLTAGAEIIIADAKARVPESALREKHLRDSIVSRPVGASNVGCAIVIGFLEPAGRHAGFVEFGTAKMAAEPFMRPALDNSGPEAVKVIVESLRAGIEAEAKAPGGVIGGILVGAVEDIAGIVGAI